MTRHIIRVAEVKSKEITAHINKVVIMPRKFALCLILVSYILFGLVSRSGAHFQMVIPADDIVQQSEARNVSIDILFWHPFAGRGMSMVAPVRFGVMTRTTNIDLLNLLKTKTFYDSEGQAKEGFNLTYRFKRPGDHIFYVEPKPYWDAAEEIFIVHYTKVVVNAYGLHEGWDKPVGLKTEIIPLTRSYGLYAGNAFQGLVVVNNKPAGFTPVEVEYYNRDGKVQSSSPMATQVVKTDANGVFTYVMPLVGWWGFAALSADETSMIHAGKSYPVEIGAVFWVKTYAIK